MKMILTSLLVQRVRMGAVLMRSRHKLEHKVISNLKTDCMLMWYHYSCLRLVLKDLLGQFNHEFKCL